MFGEKKKSKAQIMLDVVLIRKHFHSIGVNSNSVLRHFDYLRDKIVDFVLAVFPHPKEHLEE